MIDGIDIKYENTSGQSIHLNQDPFYWRGTNLFDYDWKYSASRLMSSRGSKISDLHKEAEERVILLDIISTDTATALNQLLAIFEIDVLNGADGKLWFGNQYIPCMIKSNKKPDLLRRSIVQVDLTAIVSIPLWITEELHTFEPLSTGSTDGFIFPLGFPYGFVSPDVRTLINDHYGSCMAKISFYGPCTDPEINLGPSTYKVFGELLPGERFEIDQVAMTVTKITAGGERLNFLYARNKAKSVFDRIPAGESFVTATDFTFDILLYKERSEPKWS